MNTLILFALLAYAFAAFRSVATYNNANCDGAVVNYVSTWFDDLDDCQAVACAGVSVGSFAWSVQTTCSESWTDLPENAVGWAIYPRGGCAGKPTSVAAYGKGCLASGIGSSFQLGCSDDNTAEYQAYLNDNCEGDGIGNALSYKYGCTSFSNILSVSQIGCGDNSQGIDYAVYLEGWLKYIKDELASLVASFRVTAGGCFEANGDFELDGTKLSVEVTVNSTCTDAQLQAFVDQVCGEIKAAAQVAVCLNANCFNSDNVVEAACDYQKNKKRDANQATTITIGSDLSTNNDAPSGSASGLVFSVAALMLSVLALVF